MRPVNFQESLATNNNVVTTQPFHYWSESVGRQMVIQNPYTRVPRNSHDYDRLRHEEDDDDVMQICNLNESVLRLEEMAEKRRMTFQLSKDGINGLHALYEELLELNSRAERERARITPCRVTAARGFSGLKSEDVDLLDERKLIQLVQEFGLENVEELPVLQMEALNNYI